MKNNEEVNFEISTEDMDALKNFKHIESCDESGGFPVYGRKLIVGDVFLETTLKNIKEKMVKLQFLYIMHRVWKDTRSREQQNM